MLHLSRGRASGHEGEASCADARVEIGTAFLSELGVVRVAEQAKILVAEAEENNLGDKV